MTARLRSAWPLAAVVLGALSVACDGGEPDETLYYWDVKVTGVSNNCTESEQGFAESYAYAVGFDGSLASLKIDDGEEINTFATGNILGCTMAYESQVVGEPDRDGGPVQWVLSGQSTYRSGGDGCNMEEQVTDYADMLGIDPVAEPAYLGGNEPGDLDWVGMESFEIVASENEGIPVGCTYTLFVAGTYRGSGG